MPVLCWQECFDEKTFVPEKKLPPTERSLRKNVKGIRLNRNIFKTPIEKVTTFSYNKIVTYKEQGRRTRLKVPPPSVEFEIAA